MGTTTTSKKKSKKRSAKKSVPNGKSSDLRTRVEIITPRKAKKYLGMMEKNRRIRRRHVEHLSSLMKDGHWKVTGDAIRFNTKGELIDGQHRLQACVEAGITFETLVIRNVQDDAFMDLDTGAVRSPGDLLSIAGFQRANNTASVIRMAASLLEVESAGVPTKEEGKRKKFAHTSLGKRKIAPATLLEWGSTYGEALLEAVRVTNSPGAKSVCRPPSLFGGLYFLFAQNNKKGADLFFQMLTEGRGWEHKVSNDPVYLLQRILLKLHDKKHQRRPNYYRAALAIKAWNAFQDRQPMTNLRFSENEAWPEINRRPRRLTEAEAEAQEKKRVRRAKKVREYDDRAKKAKKKLAEMEEAKKKAAKKTAKKKGKKKSKKSKKSKKRTTKKASRSRR